ncbi:hypothetical protein ACPS01_13750 [Priestia aryabhattai]
MYLQHKLKVLAAVIYQNSAIGVTFFSAKIPFTFAVRAKALLVLFSYVFIVRAEHEFTMKPS